MLEEKSHVYEFQSIGQRYAGSTKADLQLRVDHYGDDAVEITLTNLLYGQQRLRKIKQLLLLLCIYGAYIAVTSTNLNTGSPLRRNALLDLAFGAWAVYILVSVFSLVKSEKLLYCLDFALQLQMTRFLSRTTNAFIPVTNIHDVVINEVIENLDVHYILILRTKGSLFLQKPIITTFSALRPSIDCLEIIYKNINKVMRKNAENT